MNKNYFQIFFYISFLLIIGCTKKVQHLSNVTNTSYRIDEAYTTLDDNIEGILKPYRKELNDRMSIKLSHSPEEMIKSKPSSPLTNFMADAILLQSRDTLNIPIDLAIQNYGGVRVNSWPSGNINMGHAYELMPFDNLLVIIKIKGKDLKPIFDKMAGSGGWPISIGTSFDIIDSTYANNIIINDEALIDDKTYTLALPDYVANGGDNAELVGIIYREETGILIRDLIISYLLKNKNILPDHSMRIKYNEK